MISFAKNGMRMTQKKISYFVLSITLTAIIACILYDANWVLAELGDDFQFIKTTAIGRGVGAWAGRGRFWPLGLVDYSILTLVPYGYTATAHFVYTSIVMVASVFLMFSFFLKITKKQYFISLFYILILFSISSFMLIHITCIYPERMMLFCLSAFMLCYWKAEQEQSTKYYFLAFLAAAYVTYTKEPVFGSIAIIALTNLLFGYDKSTQKDKKFHYALLVNSVIYLIIYIYRWFFKDTRRHNNLYNDGKWLFSSDFDLIGTVSKQFYLEPLLYFLCVVCIIRLYFVLLKKDHKHLFLDGLFFAGIGYAVAMISISLVHNVNYVFPAIILTLPSLVYWTSYFFKNRQKGIAILMIAVSMFLIKDTAVRSYNRTIFILNCRKIEMPVISAVAEAYRNGKEIIWLTSYPLNMYDGYVSGNHLSYDSGVEWEFELYTYFLNYFLQIEPKKKISILKVRNDLEGVAEDSIILCQEKDRKNELVKSKGFHEIIKIHWTNIYTKSEYLDSLIHQLIRTRIHEKYFVQE